MIHPRVNYMLAKEMIYAGNEVKRDISGVINLRAVSYYLVTLSLPRMWPRYRRGPETQRSQI